jgi:predicted CXXCH cytochrome family protein
MRTRSSAALIAAVIAFLVCAVATGRSQTTPQYVGSQSCKRCHAPTFERWSKTLMANVVRDPKEHPEAVLPDFSKPDPLLTFKLSDVAFVYGSKWKQRYFTRVGNDYYPLSAQWDVTHRVWRPYFVQPNTDWWVPHYPADNMKRPTGALCDGCHSVNYNIETKTVTEWNVGCERCHGPGGDHVAQPTARNIVNPSKLDFVRANDTCIQCHSQGQPLRNPQAGQFVDWPVGFHEGGRLSDFWSLEEHRLGETSFTHFADGTAHKNRMQGNDFVQSQMYKRGVTCFSCHDVHGTPHNADLIKPARDLCLTCHSPMSPNGPRAASIEQHTHHAPGSAGSDCVACHMPLVAQTIADVNVRSHTFRFVMPGESERLKVPNACVACHKDKTNAWATAQLKGWPEFSPWRIGQ